MHIKASTHEQWALKPSIDHPPTTPHPSERRGKVGRAKCKKLDYGDLNVLDEHSRAATGTFKNEKMKKRLATAVESIKKEINTVHAYALKGVRSEPASPLKRAKTEAVETAKASAKKRRLPIVANTHTPSRSTC